jgi:penicillin-binding protein 1A
MTGASGQMMTLRDGLVYSKNTITAQVSQEVGIARIVAFAQSMGIDQSKLDPVPSLALGTSPVTLYEMVSAYATIARQGQYHKPVMIKRISDRHGKVLAEFGAESRRAMSADSAVELIDMMRGVVSRGTGTLVKTRFGISSDIAGKTGTTQNNTDGWFILMHPELVSGAWVGFNDARVTMRSSYWGQGGHNAILVVGDFFREATKGKLIDTKATFPPSRRPVIVAPPPMPADEGPPTITPQDAQRNDDQVGLAPSTEVLVRHEGDSQVVIGDRAGVAAMRRDSVGEPPKTAADLERMMSAMGLDPATGASRGRVLSAPARPASPPLELGSGSIRSPGESAALPASAEPGALIR